MIELAEEECMDRPVDRTGAVVNGVLDASPEMLASYRERLGPASRRVACTAYVDLFDWRPARTWDACVFGFWLRKFPTRAPGSGFMQAVADASRPGGRVVCCLDKAGGAERSDGTYRRTNPQRWASLHDRRPSSAAESSPDVFHAAGMDVDGRPSVQGSVSPQA